jgi:trk system potassium uptake protein TrkA
MRVHIVVVGCGRVGSSLGIALVKGGHSVAIIDKAAEAFRRLPADWGGEAINGMGFDRPTLEAAGASRAGALAAVTSGDNSNILCARIARETYRIPAVVARIYDPRRAEIYQRLGIPTVATVTWTMEQVHRRLFPEETFTEWTDPTGQIQLVERALPASWCGFAIHQVEALSGARVVVVTRGGIARVGAGDLIGQEGDVLHVAVNDATRLKLEEILGGSPQSAGVRA